MLPVTPLVNFGFLGLLRITESDVYVTESDVYVCTCVRETVSRQKIDAQLNRRDSSAVQNFFVDFVAVA